MEATLLPLVLRGQLLSSAVLPKALYGAAVAPPNKRDLKHLRACVGRALWGQGNKWRSNEILFTLLSQGHVVDPQQAWAYTCLCTLRRVLSRQPALVETWHRVVRHRLDIDNPRFAGPGKAFLSALKLLGASVQDPFTMVIAGAGQTSTEVSLLSGDAPKFQHQLREGLRHEQWQRLVRRRPDFAGLEHGVDRKATGCLNGKLRGLEAYRLRVIQAGGVATMQRLHKQRRAESPLCPCCGLQPESTRHIFDECPHHEPLRLKVCSRAQWDLLPDSLKLHGILPGASCPHLPTAPDDRAGWTAEVQYLLLDILAQRQELAPVAAPLPRWGGRPE